MASVRYRTRLGPHAFLPRLFTQVERWRLTSTLSTPARCGCRLKWVKSIDVRHTMASGALPPGFAPVEIDGEFLIVGYRTDMDALRAVVPEPLQVVPVVFEGVSGGPAALELAPHAVAPVASLTVLEVISGTHIVADITLGMGAVIHDYLT